jgi:hypothetical protein
METVPKSKSKALSPKKKSVAAGRKAAAEIKKTKTVRVRADKAQMKEAAATPAVPEVTNEERQQLIAEAAYFRAERRNFVPGYELQDWLDAEAEFDAGMLKVGKNSPAGNA